MKLIAFIFFTDQLWILLTKVGNNISLCFVPHTELGSVYCIALFAVDLVTYVLCWITVGATTILMCRGHRVHFVGLDAIRAGNSAYIRC